MLESGHGTKMRLLATVGSCDGRTALRWQFLSRAVLSAAFWRRDRSPDIENQRRPWPLSESGPAGPCLPLCLPRGQTGWGWSVAGDALTPCGYSATGQAPAPWGAGAGGGGACRASLGWSPAEARAGGVTGQSHSGE